ncbi:MAG: hemerythrin domain-containing protein [Elusimicrobia bacterium]|nr:hemerythrin domain-containing protein [Elusimicrobiota bacterium]
MSVFDSLAQEHALLLKLVARLERAAAETDERVAARETRNILLVLFKALEAHQRLEHMIYDESPEPPTPAAYKALASVESQHQALAALREEAAALLGSISPEGGRTIRELAPRLGQLLRRLIEDEETKLWPSFNAYAGRSTLHRLSMQAREQLKTMERDLDRYWAEVETYMAQDR